MAKRKVNKSQVIRTYCEENPSATADEIATVLNETRNLGVSTQYVANVKSKAKQRELSRTVIDLDALIEAKKFVEKVGGLKAAQEALTVIAQINA